MHNFRKWQSPAHDRGSLVDTSAPGRSSLAHTMSCRYMYCAVSPSHVPSLALFIVLRSFEVHTSSNMPCNIPAAKLLGTTVDDGRYKLLDTLGRGSGGVVFRALDTATQEHYAVKVVRRAQKGTRAYTFQQRELHFHRTVSGHRNIITLHRIIEQEPYIYLVMDLCAGGDLFKFLTEKGIFKRNDQLVKSVFVQLIDAVDACHRNGIYHRDIKPENIMCNEDGTEVRLGDFGLSTDSKCSRNFGAGTSAYMSPGTLATDSSLLWLLICSSFLRMYRRSWGHGLLLVPQQRYMVAWRHPHQHDLRPQPLATGSHDGRLFQNIRQQPRFLPIYATHLSFRRLYSSPDIH